MKNFLKDEKSMIAFLDNRHKLNELSPEELLQMCLCYEDIIRNNNDCILERDAVINDAQNLLQEQSELLETVMTIMEAKDSKIQKLESFCDRYQKIYKRFLDMFESNS